MIDEYLDEDYPTVRPWTEPLPRTFPCQHPGCAESFEYPEELPQCCECGHRLCEAHARQIAGVTWCQACFTCGWCGATPDRLNAGGNPVCATHDYQPEAFDIDNFREFGGMGVEPW
jgi:hypothetical protein